MGSDPIIPLLQRIAESLERIADAMDDQDDDRPQIVNSRRSGTRRPAPRRAAVQRLEPLPNWENSDMLRAGDVARMLNISVGMVRKLVSQGELMVVLIGRSHRFPRWAVEALMAKDQESGSKPVGARESPAPTTE